MKLFVHYCLPVLTNCYILGALDGAEYGADTSAAGLQDAIVIDPGTMDGEILNIIERNNLNILGILITHDHANHVRGIKTLKKIYDSYIFGMNQVIQEHQVIMVKDGNTLQIGPFAVEVISIPGHSVDSVVFRIDNLLFTGDVLSAGLIGTTLSSFGATSQITALRSKIFSLPGDYIVLPGHGPPSSLDSERQYNAGIQRFEQRINRKPLFSAEFYD